MPTTWVEQSDGTYRPVLDRAPAGAEVAPSSTGTAKVGVSPRWAREDHDHNFSVEPHTHEHTHPDPDFDYPRFATIVVAANDSTALGKDGADFLCDGTNDEVTIEAAMDALPAAGGRVLCLEGTFGIGADITRPSSKTSIDFAGMGQSTIFQRASDFNDTLFDWQGASTSTRDRIADLTIDENNLNPGFGVLVRGGTPTSQRLLIENVLLINPSSSTGTGISVANTSNVTVRDCVIRKRASGGSFIIGISVSNPAWLLIEGNQIEGETTRMTGISASTGIGAITGNLLTGCDVGVYNNQSVFAYEVEGNTFDDCDYGVHIKNDATLSLIAGNHFTGCNTADIRLENSSYRHITGNTFDACAGTQSILLDTPGAPQALENNISGNKFRKTGSTPTYCVKIADVDCVDTRVTDNDGLNGYGTAFLNDSGVTTKAINNRGHNPQGAATITVTASPFTYTAGATPETVHIYGGTVTTVVKDGVTLHNGTDVAVDLSPNEAVVVTYTGAPTMAKNRQ